MDKIYTAMDDARRKKLVSVNAYFRALSVQAAQRGRIAFPWDGRTVSGSAVEAFVDHGRWVARCDICGGAEYVDPGTPIFFCCGCGNNDSRAARPVTFPENREEIERELLKIAVVPGFGRTEMERMMNGAGGRMWTPSQPPPNAESTHLGEEQDEEVRDA